MNGRSLRLSVGLFTSLGLTCLSALGQTPPPAAPPPAPTQPPADPPTDQPDEQPVPAPGSGLPARPARPSLPPKLPDVPYESIVKKDADGKVIRLSQPAVWAALRNNPLITKEDWVRLEPIFAQRKADCESIVIANLDVVELVDSGKLENTAENGKMAVKVMRDMFLPITPEGGDFSTRLGKEGMLTTTQVQFTQKILREYNAAIANEIRATLPPKADKDDITSLPVIRFFYRQRVEETMWAYHGMLDEASRSMDKLVPGMKPEAAAKIKDDCAQLSAGTSDQKRAEVMKAMMPKLSLEERRALLSSTLELRPKK